MGFNFCVCSPLFCIITLPIFSAFFTYAFMDPAYSLIFFNLQESNLLRSPHCLSASSDSLYLQFKPTICALNYPRCEHTNCAIRFKRVIFRYHYVMQINIIWIEIKQRYLYIVLHFTRPNLMLINPPNGQDADYDNYLLKMFH